MSERSVVATGAAPGAVGPYAQGIDESVEARPSGLITGPQSTAAALQRQLRPRRTCPLDAEPAASPGRVTHWVDPEVVVEVEFTVWTIEGRLRHPVFRRVRADKAADEAVGDA